MVNQLGRGDLAQPSQRMVLVDDQDQLVVAKHGRNQAWPWPALDDAAVDRSSHDLRVDRRRRLDDHAQLNRGEALRESREPGGQVIAGAGRAGAEVQRTRFQMLHRLGGLLQHLERSQRGTARHRQAAAGVGEANAAAVAFQKMESERSLEVSELLGHGALREEQRSGCLRDMLGFSHGHE